MRKRKVLAFLLAGAMLVGSLSGAAFSSDAKEEVKAAETAETAAEYPYLDTSLSFEERAADLVSRMTLEEKALQTITTSAAAIPRLGVSEYNYWSEGLHGVARSGHATSFPHGLGIASTWNKEMVYDMGEAISDEARGYTNEKGKGLSYWSPTINLARDPRWGRAEEGYGEDTYLTAALAENYVNGMQGEDDTYLKTIVTLKHFLANNSEFNRHNGSSELTDKELREYYSYTFKNVVENTDVASVMSSYNRVNGVPMSANRFLLTDVLRNTWGFDGYVTSDCWAIQDIYQNHKWQPEGLDHSVNSVEATAYAINAGCDINCGSTFHVNVKQAVEQGLLSEEDLDRALIRLFTARMKTGEFDPKEDVPYTSEEYSYNNQVESEEHKQLAEDMSDEAIILLQNEDNMLPLTADQKKIVIVGEMAQRCTQGDYSADPSSENRSTPVQGITTAAKRAGSGITVDYIDNYGVTDAQGVKYLQNIQGFELGYGSSSVTKKAADADAYEACVIESNSNKNFGYINSGAYAVYKNVDVSNLKTFAVQAAGAKTNAYSATVKVHLDSLSGQVIASVDTDYTTGWQNYNTFTENVAANVSGTHDLYITLEFNYSDVNFTEAEEKLIQEADAVIVVAGTRTIDGEGALGNPDSDSAEEVDRETLDFPRNQAGSILKCAQLNANTVVCISAVGQMNVEPFKDEVKAITWSTYNGQAQGNAIGRILYGEKNPSAKLTFSWYTNVFDLDDISIYSLQASDTSNGRTYQYFTGDVTWPFGYGLSYTNYEYSNVKIDKTSATTNDQIKVSVDVKNAGTRDGQEVVQMYVASPNADSADRPVKSLKGFEKVALKAGETKTVTMTLETKGLEFWDDENDKFDYDLGTYTVSVGPDSEQVKGTATFSMTEKAAPTLKTVTLTGKQVLKETDLGTPSETVLTAAMSDDSFVEVQDGEVTYSSSNEAVARVDENGAVTAVGIGTATITAKVTKDGVTQEGSYAVAVQESVKDLYYITNKGNNAVVAVNGGSTESGARLIEWENNGGTDQQWFLKEAGDGTYYWVNNKSNLLLSAADASKGAALIQKEKAEGDTKQLWKLEESEEDGYYLIVNAETGYALSRGPQENIAGWDLYPFIMAEKDASDEEQLWKLDALIEQYTVKVSAGEGGSVSPEGRKTVIKGGALVITVTPDEGYQVKDVLVNGESVGAVTEYVLKDMQADAVVEAVFEKAAVPTVNKEALQAAVDGAVSADEKSQYTEATWAVYEKALDTAKKVLADEKAVQTDVDAAVKALAKAQEGLEKVQPDPSEPAPSQPEPPKRPFVDVDQTSGYWYYDAVYYNYDNGIIEGVDTTHFDPLNDVVRGQFAIMLYRVEGKPAVSFADRFVDVAKNDWFADAVIWANKAEVVTGYTDGSGKFGPTDPILREQMAVMMYRYAKSKGYDVSQKADFSKFEDAASVSKYAEEAMEWAVGTGIITGKYEGTQIDPQGKALRAECAIIFQRFLEKYEK